jgi:hypothetical protein
MNINKQTNNFEFRQNIHELEIFKSITALALSKEEGINEALNLNHLKTNTCRRQ